MNRICIDLPLHRFFHKLPLLSLEKLRGRKSRKICTLVTSYLLYLDDRKCNTFFREFIVYQLVSKISSCVCVNECESVSICQLSPFVG